MSDKIDARETSSIIVNPIRPWLILEDLGWIRSLPENGIALFNHRTSPADSGTLLPVRGLDCETGTRRYLLPELRAGIRVVDLDLLESASASCQSGR